MANFRQLMVLMGELGTIPSRVAADAAEKIAHLIASQFQQGQDPYGNPWAPLRPATLAKGRRPPPLTDTGAMSSGIVVRPLRGAGIEIQASSTPYAHFHQTGTKHMAERSILPDGGELPGEWDAAIEGALTSSVKKALGR